MKSFAVLPLLAVVLVSLCGSPVPPPPADVSGTVFFDGNHNGLRDACDSSLPNRHVLLTNDERELEAVANGPGEFEFEDVPAGEYMMTLKADPGTFWPITMLAADQVLELKGRDVSDIKLGSAVVNAVPVGPRLIGLAYNDANGDGAVSENECGFGISNVQTPIDVGEIPTTSITAGSFQFVSDRASFSPLTVISPGLSDNHWWVQTSPPATAGRCVSPVAPQPRYTDGVFELNVGFQLARGTGSVSGVAFIDDDEDGVRDSGEPALDANVRLTVDCAGDYQHSIFTSSLGEKGYEFKGLPPGTYVITRDWVGEYLGELLRPELGETRVTVADGEAATADYPFVLQPSGTVEAYVFEDQNGNGEIDQPVDALRGNTQVCYRAVDSDHEECSQGQWRFNYPRVLTTSGSTTLIVPARLSR